jgi:hypothetical protein
MNSYFNASSSGYIYYSVLCNNIKIFPINRKETIELLLNNPTLKFINLWGFSKKSIMRRINIPEGGFENLVEGITEIVNVCNYKKCDVIKKSGEPCIYKKIEQINTCRMHNKKN